MQGDGPYILIGSHFVSARFLVHCRSCRHAFFCLCICADQTHPIPAPTATTTAGHPTFTPLPPPSPPLPPPSTHTRRRRCPSMRASCCRRQPPGWPCAAQPHKRWSWRDAAAASASGGMTGTATKMRTRLAAATGKVSRALWDGSSKGALVCVCSCSGPGCSVLILRDGWDGSVGCYQGVNNIA